MMKNITRNWHTKILNLFSRFELIVISVLSLFVGLIVILSLLRIGVDFYYIFVQNITSIETIAFEDYQSLFGKIMTLIISIEFLNSILKVFKTKDIKSLTLDVVLIAALAIARKLIIYDYRNIVPIEGAALGGLLVSIGVLYFLIKFSKP